MSRGVVFFLYWAKPSLVLKSKTSSRVSLDGATANGVVKALMLDVVLVESEAEVLKLFPDRVVMVAINTNLAQR